MKSSVTKIFKFEMAHQLKNSYSKECQEIHGHGYRLEVTFEGPIDGDGFVIDFKRIKEMVNPIVEYFDHNFITAISFGNYLEVGFDVNPTAENMAHYIFKMIRKQTTLIKNVRLWETATSFTDVGY